MIPILILAAGSSFRMRGLDKLLQPVAGQPLLQRLAQVALATGADVYMTLPPGATARRAVLDALAIHQIETPNASEGMAASLRTGLKALPDAATGVLLLLADLPEITTADLQALLYANTAHPDKILRATSADGLPGHPVLFPRRLFPALAALTGAAGARHILSAHQPDIRLIPLPGSHATTDLDTPEAWAIWRARTGL